MGGQITTVGADGVHFGDVLGYRQELAHRAKRLPAKIHIEPGDNDAFARAGQRLYVPDDGGVEKLGFVEADDGYLLGEVEQHLAVRYGRRGEGIAVVTDDLVATVARVDHRFEYFYPLPGEQGAF